VPGRYALTVSRGGFREENQELDVLLGSPGTWNITLEIAGRTGTHLHCQFWRFGSFLWRYL
jgi:hypothetical protein